MVLPRKPNWHTQVETPSFAPIHPGHPTVRSRLKCRYSRNGLGPLQCTDSSGLSIPQQVLEVPFAYITYLG